MTQPNHIHTPLATFTGDRPLSKEEDSIQQAMAVLLDAGITFEVLALDRAA